MALTNKADYALRAMVELAAINNSLISAKQLSSITQVPYPFMTKIIKELSTHGLAEVYRGSNGGVKISTDPNKTTALQVVEAISGPLTLNQCVNQPKSCSRSDFCPMHDMLVKAQKDLKKALSINLKALANSQIKNKKKKGGK